LGNPLDLPPDQLLYRQLTPTSWDQKKNRLNSNVFRRRTNEQGVSVYWADLQSPRGVLQVTIDAQHRKLTSGDPEQVAAAENFFRLYGTTVESLVEAGWRIARVPVVAFTERSFTLEEPDTIGHLNVFGSVEEFARYTNELGKCAELLTADQCLEK
jgi:hypothetical protein